MDINILRVGVTIAGLVLFLALVAWAWSRRRQGDFEAAARLPFSGEAPAAPATDAPGSTR